nr:methylesterase 10-like [Ipomoea batatas]
MEMMRSAEKKHHFVLVHGFGHGAWCWYKLIPLLRLSGNHRVTALDLAGCGTHRKQIDEVATVFQYVEPLFNFMSALPRDEKVVLVGHSYGGIPVSLAMQKFPDKISVAVFVSAYMPACKSPPATLIQEYFRRNTADSLMDCEVKFERGLENPPTSAIFGPNFMKAILYKHCKEEDLELAKMLMRPNGFYVEDLAKESLLTEGKYGTVRRAYVVCQDDEVMSEEFQKYNIENSPPDEVKSIAGAAHMVMLSKPRELCVSLLELAAKYSS